MKKFEEKLWLATPTMHGDEKKYIDVAFDENYITTDGDNVRSVELIAAEKVGCKPLPFPAVRHNRLDGRYAFDR